MAQKSPRMSITTPSTTQHSEKACSRLWDEARKAVEPPVTMRKAPMKMVPWCREGILPPCGDRGCFLGGGVGARGVNFHGGDRLDGDADTDLTSKRRCVYSTVTEDGESNNNKKAAPRMSLLRSHLFHPSAQEVSVLTLSSWRPLRLLIGPTAALASPTVTRLTNESDACCSLPPPSAGLTNQRRKPEEGAGPAG
ncbi:hypothetical protein EYF80_045590 [Liparis tanakae]|uniref:Uncharacterized protein n=1 Tax=Liparis tanakae TaxID=230148 RepID=A0A4Z2FTQ9_9TELE|nr:hypothetical protein EYF80_045590 [Liparis tanakae]